jgi:hypothetical protein
MRLHIAFFLGSWKVYWYNLRRQENATIAQLVEQTLRKRQVVGSNPTGGSDSIIQRVKNVPCKGRF